MFEEKLVETAHQRSTQTVNGYLCLKKN